MKHFTLIFAVLLSLGPMDGWTQVQRLINTRDMYPSVSADGKQVVFQSNRTGSNQLFILSLDDGGLRQLGEFPQGAETPVFSPDGRSIVFALYVGEDNNDVFTINADGSGLKQLTDGPGYDGHPHWSADGQRIVFNSDRTSPDPNAGWSDRWHEIFSMKADGSDVRQHTRCKAVCTYGSFSPDGKKVLYRKVINAAGFNWELGSIEKNSEIFIADLDGANEVNISNNAAFDGWPVFSPNGQRIAFASNRSGPARTGQIWLVNSDGSGLRQLSQGPWSHAQPAWAQDGQSIFAYQLTETEADEFGSIVRITLTD
jgi:Tol biopolymer transport system component